MVEDEQLVEILVSEINFSIATMTKVYRSEEEVGIVDRIFGIHFCPIAPGPKCFYQSFRIVSSHNTEPIVSMVTVFGRHFYILLVFLLPSLVMHGLVESAHGYGSLAWRNRHRLLGRFLLSLFYFRCQI